MVPKGTKHRRSVVIVDDSQDLTSLAACKAYEVEDCNRWDCPSHDPSGYTRIAKHRKQQVAQ